MEDTLGEHCSLMKRTMTTVLILVVMEDTLGDCKYEEL